jgi:hypothetical protein
MFSTFAAPDKVPKVAGSVFLCISFSVKHSTCDPNQQLPEKFVTSSASAEELPQQL